MRKCAKHFGAPCKWKVPCSVLCSCIRQWLASVVLLSVSLSSSASQVTTGCAMFWKASPSGAGGRPATF